MNPDTTTPKSTTNRNTDDVEGHRRKRGRGRGRLGLATLSAALVALAGGLTVASAGTAVAQDASCVKRGSYATSHGYNVAIPASGWGWTAWRVNPSKVVAWDLCDHGGLDISVNVYNKNVLAKGGILTTQLQYYSTGVGWRNAPLVNRSPVADGWYTATYTAGVYGVGHVDLCRTCRIQYVRFITTVWTKQDASRWTPLSSKTLQLNLVSPSWTST